MADRKISQLSERASSVLGTDLLVIVGNTATTPANFRVQVKNFLNNLAIDYPATSIAALKVSANVTANATAATLVGAELDVRANSSINVTVRDRVGLIVKNEILNGNSNVTGQMWCAHLVLDVGNSNIAAANTYGLVIDHTIANTAWSRLVSPRAYIAIKENAGTAGNTTSYLMEVGAQGNTVSQNNTTGNSSVVYSRTADMAANRTLKLHVNGEDIWLLASNVAPSGA